MNMKTEIWNGNEIRFVEKEDGEWWAVGNDVAKALEYARPYRAVAVHCKGVLTYDVLTSGGIQQTQIINEIDIYELIFAAAKQSRNSTIKAKASEFKMWVYDIIKTLRKSTGLEAFQIFRMLDKEHQKEAMKHLHANIETPKKVDFIKANIIANKAISTKHGYPKAVKKKDMPADWLPERQPILDDTVELMSIKDKFGLDLSISDAIYKKYCS